jgi:hypothetical protein
MEGSLNIGRHEETERRRTVADPQVRVMSLSNVVYRPMVLVIICRNVK